MEYPEFNFDADKNSETRLLNLMQRMWNLSAGQVPADEFDLTMSQLRMIDFVGKNTGCHLQNVAEGLQLSAPTVSVGIRKLEEAGWLERHPDPEDGRATCLFLTTKSDAAIRDVIKHQQKMSTLFFDGLDGAEQQLLLDLLEKGINSMESRSLK